MGSHLVKRYRRKVWPLSLIFVVPLLMFTGISCDEPEVSGQSGIDSSPSTAFTIIDDLGKTFEFEGPVNSIVSLAPSNTEIVFALGAGDKLIGRTEYCNYPAEAESVESVGGFATPNKEKIVTLDPDIVLATDFHEEKGDTAWLEDIGLRVVTLDPKTLSDVMNSISLVGKLTGKEAEAAALVANMQERIDHVNSKTAGLTSDQRPRVLHITWHDPLWTAGEGTFVHTLIGVAGGVNIFGDVTDDTQVSLDTAVTRNPEVITVCAGHGSAGNTSYEYIVAGDSPFKTTEAYINGRIHLIDADMASRGGPRIVEALEMYARFIHPEIFG